MQLFSAAKLGRLNIGGRVQQAWGKLSRVIEIVAVVCFSLVDKSLRVLSAAALFPLAFELKGMLSGLGVTYCQVPNLAAHFC
mmetsp:Transcript_98161/g.194391  ORF Transcript_98161/g.194391 Transcript_98161/m.194391 type:complete len:82 (-) Transcript_98161:487-732(-)